MAEKPKPKVIKTLAAKARQVLEFAQERAKEAADWLEVHFAIFSAGGKASELFSTESERSAWAALAATGARSGDSKRSPRPASLSRNSRTLSATIR